MKLTFCVACGSAEDLQQHFRKIADPSHACALGTWQRCNRSADLRNDDTGRPDKTTRVRAPSLGAASPPTAPAPSQKRFAPLPPRLTPPIVGLEPTRSGDAQFLRAITQEAPEAATAGPGLNVPLSSRPAVAPGATCWRWSITDRIVFCSRMAHGSRCMGPDNGRMKTSADLVAPRLHVRRGSELRGR